jgi:hypothetical protein
MTGANHAGCRIVPQYNPRAFEKQYQWTGSMAVMANVLNSVAIDRDDRDHVAPSAVNAGNLGRAAFIVGICS